ncbi:hypothetical protein F5880DRAFT_1589538 [Lentinula raphanica]|nr:hypothetical protein F5880DRAFT_1589538 [Lentinula raphanica]
MNVAGWAHAYGLPVHGILGILGILWTSCSHLSVHYIVAGIKPCLNYESESIKGDLLGSRTDSNIVRSCRWSTCHGEAQESFTQTTEGISGSSFSGEEQS